MKVKCKNCGAMIDSTQVLCPYCDAVQPEASENEYMSNLKQMKDDLGLTGDVEKKRILRATVKKCLVMVGVLFIVIVVTIGVSYVNAKNIASYGMSQHEIKQAFDWYEENVDKMNLLVESDDVEAAAELVKNAGIDDASRSILKRWKYYHIYSVYQNYYHSYLKYRDDLEKGSGDESFYFSSCYKYAIELLGIGEKQETYEFQTYVANMTEKEQMIYEEWTKNVREFLLERVGMTPADVESDLSAIYDNGTFDYEQVQSYGKMRYKDYQIIQK